MLVPNICSASMHRFTTGSSRALCLQAPNSAQGLPHLRNSVHMAVQMWVQVSTAAWKQLAIRPLLQSFLYFMGKEIVLLWEPRVWKVYKILSKACIPKKKNRPILHLTFISCGRKAFSYNPWLKAADIWYWLCLRQMPCTWIFLFVSLPSKHRSTHSFTRQSLPCGFCVSSSSVDSSLWNKNWTENFILGMNTVKLQYTH